MSMPQPSPNVPIVSLRDVGPDTLLLLTRASAICRAYRSDVDLSVTGMLLAMTLGHDEASAWFADTLKSRGVDPLRWAESLSGEVAQGYEDARRGDKSAPWVSRGEASATPSAAMLLDLARDVRDEVDEHDALAPHHLLAALLYRGNPEGWFLKAMGVDREDAGRRFLEWIGRRRPREVERWARIPGGPQSSAPERAPQESARQEPERSGAEGVEKNVPAESGDLHTGGDVERLFLLSSGALDTLSRAVTLARAVGADPTGAQVDPSLIIAGMLAHAEASDTKGASRLLAELARPQKFSGTPMEGAAALLNAAGRSVRASGESLLEVSTGMLSPAVLDVLARAKRFAGQAWITPQHSGETRNRHLLAALVTGGTAADPELRKVLAALGTSPGDLRDRLLRYVREAVIPRWDREEPWTRLLEVDPLAGYRSDAPEGRDLLDLRREVGAIATLIAARDVTPPLSIGLFGAWGSGKTFFMKQVAKRIDELCEESRRLQGRSPHCSRVVPIWFNAWTYMDADLWASLASEVFRQLGSAVERFEGGDAARSLREHLAVRLDSCKAQVEQTEEEQRQATKAVDAAKEKLDAFVKDRETTSERLAVAARNSAELSDAVRAAGKALGLDPAIADVLHILDGVAQAKGETRQLVALWKRVNARSRFVSVALLVAAPIAVTFTAGTLKDAAWFRSLAGFVALAATAAVQAFAWLKPLLAQVSAARGRVAKVAGDVERADEEIARRTAAEEQQLRAALASAEDAVKRAQEVHLAARQQAEAVGAELADLKSGRVLDRFIRERLAAGDYKQKLGMVALVRSDFDRLAELVKEQPEVARADRIVLFVDDLDRCPSSLVAEVLQAVHLLLAFPLFVVVVGVDARWVVHSLAQHHAELTAEAGLDGQVMTSTPVQYLEKIFQIPFRLNPLGRTSYERLVTALTSGGDKEQAAPAAAPPRATGVVAGGASAVRGGQESSPPSPDTAAARPGDAPVTPAPAPQAGGEGQEAAPPEPGETPAEPLRLDAHEVTFMKSLFSLIPSPRSAKRFVNLYQFLRATLTPAQRALFADPLRGDHKAAAVLLAAVCGHSEQADDLFDEIATAAGTTRWGELVKSRSRGGNRGAGEVLAAEDLRRMLRRIQDSTLEDLPLSTFQQWLPAVGRFSFNAAAAHPEPPQRQGKNIARDASARSRARREAAS